MTPDATTTTAPRTARRRARLLRSRIATALYYLAVLVGLVLLYGRGDLPTAGFIYQSF